MGPREGPLTELAQESHPQTRFPSPSPRPRPAISPRSDQRIAAAPAPRATTGAATDPVTDRNTWQSAVFGTPRDAGASTTWSSTSDHGFAFGRLRWPSTPRSPATTYHWEANTTLLMSLGICSSRCDEGITSPLGGEVTTDISRPLQYLTHLATLHVRPRRGQAPSATQIRLRRQIGQVDSEGHNTSLRPPATQSEKGASHFSAVLRDSRPGGWGKHAMAPWLDMRYVPHRGPTGR